MSASQNPDLRRDLKAYGQRAQVAPEKDEQKTSSEGAEKDQGAKNAQIAAFK
jgi:hypothetical protein